MRIRTSTLFLTLSALLILVGGCSKSGSRAGTGAAPDGGGGASLYLFPEEGAPGDTVTASGGGFGQEPCKVELFWDSVDGPSLGTATVENGSIEIKITIPAGAQFGEHIIIVKSVEGAEGCDQAPEEKTAAVFDIAITQPPTGPFDYAIALKDRIVLPAAGVDLQLIEEIKASEQSVTHLLVQLHSLPRKYRREIVDGTLREVPAGDIAALKALGITPLEYLNGTEGTGTTYLASVSKEVKSDDPRFAEMVRAMVRLDSGDKIDPALLGGTAGAEGALVLFFSDVGDDAARAVFTAEGIEGATSRAPGLWQVSAAPATLQALAGEDGVERIEAGPTPFLPTVDEARKASGIDEVQDLNVSSGVYLGLSGAGVRIGIFDGGVDAGHGDLASRMLRLQAPIGDHGTAVAAVAAGTGISSTGLDAAGHPNGGAAFQWRGVAPGAVIAAMEPALGKASVHSEALAAFGVHVANHSYALDPLGRYGVDAAVADAVARGDEPGIPARPTVWAAGNNADTKPRGCTTGGADLPPRSPRGDDDRPQYPEGCPDAYLAGYFSILGPAKNAICVGSVEKGSLLHSPSSSLGPTLDGRLKPDLCAVGHPLVAAGASVGEDGVPAVGNGYRGGGTSLAAPVVSGTLALLLEKFRDDLGVDIDRSPPLPSTLKAILIHTARDLAGTDPTVNPDTEAPVTYGKGPDWTTGYGLVDAEAAVAFVDGRRFLEGEVTAGEPADEYLIAVRPGQTELKVTLAWDDAAGSAAGSETAPKLVNDLDLTVMEPDGTVHGPLVLPSLSPRDCDGNASNGIDPGTCAGIDPAAQDYSGPAAEGVDRRNVVEQVALSNPAGLQPGSYRVRVSALNADGVSVRLPFEGAQKYSLAGITMQRAELSIAMTDSPDPAVAGESLLYTVKVTNAGPDAAADVMVIDVLPAGLRPVTNTDACEESPPGTLACRLGDLSPSATREYAIRVAIDPDLLTATKGPRTIVNRATVFSGTPQEDASDDAAECPTIVEDRADLRVTKVSKPDRALPAGERGTCTIFVDNLGPSTAREVLLVDTILSDGNFTVSSVTTSQGTAEPVTGGVIRCSLGDLAPASATKSGRATVTVELTAMEAMDIEDIATVTSGTPDPEPANNRAEASIAVDSSADLELKMTATPDPVVAGATVTYTLTLSNEGPSESRDVKVEDILPTGVSVESIETPDGGSWTAGVPGDPFRPATFSFGVLAPSASVRAIIRASVEPGARGTLRNDAKVSSSTLDRDASNNQAQATTGIEAKADIAVSKAAVPEPVVAGTGLTYSITVSNAGPSTARRVKLSDEFPAALTLQGAALSGGEGTAVLVEGPPRTLAAELGDLAPGAAVTVFVTAAVSPSVAAGTVLRNAASATSLDADPDRGNNAASAVTSVTTSADLVVEIGTLRDTGNPSKTFVFTVTVTNRGPSDARSVKVVDVLPQVSGVDYVYDNGHGSYDAGSNVLTFDLGTMPAGAQRSFDIHLRVRGSKGLLTNSARALSTDSDPDLGNNSATRDILVKGGV